MSAAAQLDRRRRETSLRLKFGDIAVSVRSDDDQIVHDFAELYRESLCEEAAESHLIRMEVLRSKRFWPRGRRYDVYGDGAAVCRNRRLQEVLPYLEWGINWRVIVTRSDYLQLHAASLARDGQGVVLAGTSGVGKSTLAAGLLARGWGLFSDEFALIEPQTLRLHAFPKAVCIKSGSFDIVKGLNLRIARDRPYVKVLKGAVGYINPADVPGRGATVPCPIKLILFPRYSGYDTPQLLPLPRARAAFILAGQAMNRKEFGHRTVPVLNQVVRGARCYGLDTGRVDLTCEMIEALMDEQEAAASSS